MAGRPLQTFIDRPEAGRVVLSEYHDGGSPCGVFMLRRGRWKLVYFAEGHPPLLFNLLQDPRELTNLAENAAYAPTLRHLLRQLSQILDPEGVNTQAFADQAKMIEALGGIEAIMSLPSFNHTPLQSG